jgi:hypothetical protein
MKISVANAQEYTGAIAAIATTAKERSLRTADAMENGIGHSAT